MVNQNYEFPMPSIFISSIPKFLRSQPAESSGTAANGLDFASRHRGDLLIFSGFGGWKNAKSLDVSDFENNNNSNDKYIYIYYGILRYIYIY